MSKREAAFYAKFEQLPASVQAKATAMANEMMLFQAAAMGPEEYLRTASELGAEIDIVAKFPEKVCHYSDKIAA